MTFTFGEDVNLSVNDINLVFSISGVQVLKGTLTSTSNEYRYYYHLPISGFTQSGTLMVMIQKDGFSWTQEVEVFYADK